MFRCVILILILTIVQGSLLSLVMIVKNEASSILKTIDSVVGVVDRYTILDTGSNDSTIDLIRQGFGSTPGSIFEEPFVDFSTSRNRVIELEGEKSKFALMLSGDETLVNGMLLREFLESKDSSAYNIRVRMGFNEYLSTRVHRTSESWRYEGRTHEMMRTSGGIVADVLIPSVLIRHEKSGADRGRLLSDERLLLQDWAVSGLPRTAFYLGQTYALLHNWTAAYEWYETRMSLKGWDEEEYAALMSMARIKMASASSWDCVEKLLLRASAYNPPRAEPLYELAYHHYEEKDYAVAFEYLMRAYRIRIPVSGVNIQRDIYEYHVPNLLGTVAYFVNRVDIGRRAIQKALTYKPDDPTLLRNLAYYDEL